MSARFPARVLAVFSVGFSFIVMAVTGIMLILAPQGRQAAEIDWHLLGLDRSAWEAVHNATAFFFIAVAIWHIVLHWSVIHAFVIGGGGRKATHRGEALAVLLLVALLIATAIFDLPPASWLVDLNEYFKHDFWAAG